MSLPRRTQMTLATEAASKARSASGGGGVAIFRGVVALEILPRAVVGGSVPSALRLHRNRLTDQPTELDR